MFATIDQANAAVARLAEELFMDPGDWNHVERGIDEDLARRLCAVGAGYADWADLERRNGTPDAAGALQPQDAMGRIAPVAAQTGLLSHPLHVEGLLHLPETVASQPEEWIRETLALTHLVQKEITRLEAAESTFDYIRLASDPEIDDVDLTAMISLALGMEFDLEALREFQAELADVNTRINMRDLHETLIPSGEDDFVKMALCSRTSRIDDVVHDTDTQTLARILAIAAQSIAEAGGAVASRAMLMRLAVLRPHRGTWRDEIGGHLPPLDDA